MTVYKQKNYDVAAANANKLLKTCKVSEYVHLKQSENDKKNDNLTERIIKEYQRIAFFDPRNLFDKDGNLKQIIDLDDDTAAVIASFEVTSMYKKAVETGSQELVSEVLKKLKHVDKKGALDSLARIQGMFNDKPLVNVTNITNTQLNVSNLSKEQIIQLSELMKAMQPEEVKQIKE